MFVLQDLTLLARNNVQFDGLAIAVPHTPNYLPAEHVLKQKAVSTINEWAQAGAKLSKISLKGLKVITPPAGAVALAVGAAFLADPVILGCYGREPMFLIEVGRWE